MGFDESKGRVDAFANRLQEAMGIRGMKKAELSRRKNRNAKIKR